MPRLGEVHLHDGSCPGAGQQIGYGKDHESLGKGDLDVDRFIDRLEEVNYDGPVVFELRFRKRCIHLKLLARGVPGLFRWQPLGKTGAVIIFVSHGTLGGNKLWELGFCLQEALLFRAGKELWAMKIP
jgi:hypothetical protein